MYLSACGLHLTTRVSDSPVVSEVLYQVHFGLHSTPHRPCWSCECVTLCPGRGAALVFGAGGGAVSRMAAPLDSNREPTGSARVTIGSSYRLCTWPWQFSQGADASFYIPVWGLTNTLSFSVGLFGSPKSKPTRTHDSQFPLSHPDPSPTPNPTPTPTPTPAPHR